MTTTASAFVFSGDLYIDRLTDAGVSTGYLDVSNATQMSIGETTDIKTQLSKMRATRGQVLATVATKKPATLKLTLDQIDRDKLAMALLGTVSTITQTADEATGETAAVVTLIPGAWVQLPPRSIIADDTGAQISVAPMTVGYGADPDATPTPIAATPIPQEDLEFNLRLGLVKYIGDTLTEPTETTFTYFYSAYTGSLISGSTTPTIKAKLKLDGINVVDGTAVTVTIDEATLTPSKEVDFLADDFAVLEMTGEMRTLTNKTSPYTVDIIS